VVDKAKEERLAQCIEDSKKVVREAFQKFGPENCAITWTGGKDSTLTLWIIKQVCEEDGIPLPKSMTIDEGDTFDEIHEILTRLTGEWGVDLEWCINQDVIDAAGGKLDATVMVSDLTERNQAEIKKIEYDGKSFPFEAESYVGNHLMKTVVFNEFVERSGVKCIFQGLRRDEHPARANDEYFQYKEAADLVPEHTRVCPILHITERDLWDIHHHYKIPYCPLYEQGYRSLGAKTTSLIAAEGVPAWEQDLENTIERAGRRQDKEQAMERLRRLGYM
jgi:phosphoadenosine phosphosulfate reductase